MAGMTTRELLEKLYNQDYEKLKGKKLRMTRVRGSGKGSVPGACDQSFTELYLSESWSAYWSP